jgi:hypothetical protein
MPTSTVGGVTRAPAIRNHTADSRYTNTAEAPQITPAHLGSVPERQIATASSTLPTNKSRKAIP